MKHRQWVRASFAIALVPPLLVVGFAGPVSAEERPPPFTAKQLVPSDRITGPTTLTSRQARSDQSLLNRRDADTIPVMVKLDYDSVATYAGDIAGLAATSPSKTGHELDGTGAEGPYLN